MLIAGTHLGSYEIQSALGAGGMGEVYRAKDTKLGCEVALKLLPESFPYDTDRVARFRREAQVRAARIARGPIIIHRDLKPANIMVTADDQVKVLDFGLAKMDPGGSSSTCPSTSS